MKMKLDKNPIYISVHTLATLLIAVCIVAFAGGMLFGFSGGPRALANSIPFLHTLNATPSSTADLDSFWKVWNTLDERFVDTTASTTIPDDRERVWGAIEGLTKSFGDPYTVFMRPEQTKLFKEEIAGNFSGVGMEIGLSEERIIKVIAPLKDTPAMRAGILAGDLILKINGTSTEGMITEEAVRLIRGEKGTPVTFTLYRNNATVDITVVRDTIQIPTLNNSLDEQSGVYIIELYSFTAQSPQLFANALRDFEASGSRKLIVDLRGNPGGYLSAAVEIASHFLKKGLLVVREDYQGNKESIDHFSSGNMLVSADVDIVVLVNEGSASASEIVAGALRDHQRATLIGSTTFGKGSVQELMDVDGASLKVTVAKWLTPNGDSISNQGVRPDIEVPRTPADVTNGVDPQKDRAIEYLRSL